jgi:hypothetical protein
MTMFTQLLLFPCLEWEGRVNKDGYGSRYRRNSSVLVHRQTWVDLVGPFPKGMCVLHHCDNPPCYEITHLWLGTDADNVADKMRKGRGPKGRFSSVQIADIQARLVLGIPHRKNSGNSEELATEYGVTSNRIRQIGRGICCDTIT